MNKIVPVIIVISTATMASVAANAESGWALDIEKHFEFLGEQWEASRVDYISCVLDKDIAFMKEETEEAKAVIAGKASETRLSYPKDWIDFKYYVKALSSACKDIRHRAVLDTADAKYGLDNVSNQELDRMDRELEGKMIEFLYQERMR